MVSAYGFIVLMLLEASPGIDCAHEGTPAERAICRDATLSQLDSELAASYAAALQRDPAGRGSLIAAQRAWLRDRDRACEDRTPCLVSWYKDRIAELGELTPSSSLPLCRSFIRHYEARLASHANDPSGLPPPLALVGEQRTGIEILKPVAVFGGASVESFARWGRTLAPPLVFDRSPLGEVPNVVVRIDQVPGQRWYAANYVAGTAYCVANAYFKDVGGRATPTDGPPNWGSGDGDGCGVVRGLALVDGNLVALEFDGGDAMRLDSTVTLSRWEHGRFGAPCGMVFEYEVGYASSNGSDAPPFDESCDARGCQRFRKIALAAVLEAKTSGATDQEPVMVERVVEGMRYTVSVGQATMGWRIFTDWRVTFVRVSDGTKVASLIVHAKRARLRDAAVR